VQERERARERVCAVFVASLTKRKDRSVEANDDTVTMAKNSGRGDVARV
jgi:hypothetical protein